MDSSTVEGNRLLLDLRIFDRQPEALAKITEAVAKVYFDNVLRRRFDIRPFSEAYDILFNLCPNYRIILQDKPGFEKYKLLIPEIAEITSLPIYNSLTPKPEEK
jgi:hypothetical protein